MSYKLCMDIGSTVALAVIMFLIIAALFSGSEDDK